MKRRRIFIGLVIAGCAEIAVLCAASLAGFRINTSASMPLGLWRVLPPPEPPARGVTVLFCLDDLPTVALALLRGYIAPGPCPNGSEPLLKRITAVAGDIVDVTAAGITVNGEPLPNTAQLERDPAGRDLPAQPAGKYVVGGDHVWLLSDFSPLSFDSRYYGAVPVSSIIGTAHPILVW